MCSCTKKVSYGLERELEHFKAREDHLNILCSADCYQNFAGSTTFSSGPLGEQQSKILDIPLRFI